MRFVITTAMIFATLIAGMALLTAHRDRMRGRDRSGPGQPGGAVGEELPTDRHHGGTDLL